MCFALPSQKAPGDYRASSLASHPGKPGTRPWLEGMQGEALGALRKSSKPEEACSAHKVLREKLTEDTGSLFTSEH